VSTGTGIGDENSGDPEQIKDVFVVVFEETCSCY